MNAIRRLQEVYSPGEARAVYRLVMETRFHLSMTDILLGKDKELSPNDLAEWEIILSRLLDGEPVQYVLGEADFCGLKLHVEPGVLIPRPETAQLVDVILRDTDAGCRVLEIGTGSGCIAWTLALEFPTAQLTAVDISADALAIARSQFLDADSPEGSGRSRISFVEADVLDPGETGLSATAAGKYDVIVSNPPYVMEKEKLGMRSNVLDYEPALALFVPDDDPLVFYRAIARHASVLLADHGWGLVEINALLADSTAACFRDAGFPAVSILPDLSGRPRFVFFGRE